MKEIIVKTIGKGTRDEPTKVNLPYYKVLQFLPQGKVKISVPDDEVDENGKLSKEKINQKYRGQKWDCSVTVCNDCNTKSSCCIFDSNQGIDNYLIDSNQGIDMMKSINSSDMMKSVNSDMIIQSGINKNTKNRFSNSNVQLVNNKNIKR